MELTEKNLKNCKHCGYHQLYLQIREDNLGTRIPYIFCNICKSSFEVENDSPYLNDDKTYDYLLEKLFNVWNSEPDMEESQTTAPCNCYKEGNSFLGKEYGTCTGTKECEPCTCNGNKDNCDFYKTKKPIKVKLRKHKKEHKKQ